MDREALAVYGLKKLVVKYGSRLHEMIERGYGAEALHIEVGNFEVALGEEVSFDQLVAAGDGVPCHDCGVDVAPCDPDGWPLEGRWEGYMVQDHVWAAAKGEGNLCIGCLERRLGRRLVAGDFKAGLPINSPDALMSPRLRGRMGAWEEWRRCR